MPRALIFSDIHNDRLALEKLMLVEADAYFAAGDLVSWARGLSKMGEVMKPRAGRVYVMPGNHESAHDIETFCREFGFINFHAATAEIAGVRFAGLGYSTPTPFEIFRTVKDSLTPLPRRAMHTPSNAWIRSLSPSFTRTSTRSVSPARNGGRSLRSQVFWVSMNGCIGTGSGQRP